MDVTDVEHARANEYDNATQLIMRNLQYINHLAWLNELGLSRQNKRFRIGSGKRKYYYPLNLASFFTSDLIPSVAMGSKCLMEEREVRRVLNRAGLQNTEIIHEEKFLL